MFNLKDKSSGKSLGLSFKFYPPKKMKIIQLRIIRTTLIAATLVCAFFAQSAFAQQTEPAEQQERAGGIALYDSGKYQEAVEPLQKAVAANKKDRKAWLFLGMCFARLNDNKQAKKAFHKADDISYKEEEKNDKSNNLTAIKINTKPRASYTQEARENSVSGTVKVAVEFGANGEINFVYAFKKLPHGLTEISLAAAREIEFEPAKKNEKPITVIKIVEYSFSIG